MTQSHTLDVMLSMFLRSSWVMPRRRLDYFDDDEDEDKLQEWVCNSVSIFNFSI